MSMPWHGPKGPPSDNRGPLFEKVMLAMPVLAFLFMALRVYTRLKYKGKLFWDDYLMAMATILGIASASTVPLIIQQGYGRHIYYLTPQQLLRILKIAYINHPIALWCGIFGRVSFAVTLIMLMGNTRTRRFTLYAVIATQLTGAVIHSSFHLFACRPLYKAYLPQTPGKCLSSTTLRIPGFVMNALTIVADFVLALMPALVISKLNIRRSLKAGLVVLMSLGLVNLAAAIITLAQLARWKTNSKDASYASVPSNIWVAIQFYLVIIVGSIPMLRPLFSNNRQFFSFSFLNSFGKRNSQRETPPDKQEETLVNSDGRKRGGRFLRSLPQINKSRFVTTTLRNAGPGMDETHMEKSTYDSVTEKDSSSLEKY